MDGRRVNLLVTPNHHLYASWMAGGKWGSFRFLEAGKIGEKGVARDPNSGKFKSTGSTMGNLLKFKRGALWNCSSIQTFDVPMCDKQFSNQTGLCSTILVESTGVKIEDWLRFFGVWLAEGSASKGTTLGHYIISIAQNNGEKRSKIKEWVDEVGRQVGFKAWVEESNSHSQAVKFKNKQLFKYLSKFGHAQDKYIPKEIKSLPSNLLRILLDSMVLGDGYVNKHGEIFYSTTSKKLADDVQEIALKLGKGAVITKQKRGGNSAPLYVVGIHQDEVCISKKRLKWMKYVGMVYCVTVSSGLIYVRRHGRPCWCGNSTRFSGQDSQIVLTACTNDQIMSGSQSYMLSCLMGQTLAPSMESKGALAVAAYISEFTWCIDPMHSQDPYPVGDTYAKPFMTAVVEACRLLLRGGSWKECYDLSIKLFNDGRDEWHDSPDPIASQIIICLEHDRDSLAIYGLQDISPVGGAIAGGSPIIPFAFGAILLAISMV